MSDNDDLGDRWGRGLSRVNVGGERCLVALVIYGCNWEVDWTRSLTSSCGLVDGVVSAGIGVGG